MSSRLTSSVPVVPNFLGGRWSPAAENAGECPVHNPSTGEVIALTPRSGTREVDAAVEAARKAFASWSATRSAGACRKTARPAPFKLAVQRRLTWQTEPILEHAVSSATGLRVVSVPTTYSGAEWTVAFPIRDKTRRVTGGGGGAHLAGIVYEPQLTLDLPRAETGGTALNALAHCVEALYASGRNATGDEHALEGARLIGKSLPLVLSDGHDLGARKMHGGIALAAAGLGLAHAMAQAVGGLHDG